MARHWLNLRQLGTAAGACPFAGSINTARSIYFNHVLRDKLNRQYKRAFLW